MKPKALGSFVAVALPGLAIGWLAGLSASQIATTLITAVLGIAVAAVTAVAGLSPPPDAADGGSGELGGGVEGANRREKRAAAAMRAVNFIPIALFAVCLAITAPLGIYARTFGWFAPPAPAQGTLSDVVAQWTELGLKKEDVVDALFTKWKVSAENVLPQTAAVSLPEGGLLSSAQGQNFCGDLLGFATVVPVDRERLKNDIRGYGISTLSAVESKLDDQDLMVAAKAYCADLGIQVK